MNIISFHGSGYSLEKQLDEEAEIVIGRSEDGAPLELKEEGRGGKRYSLSAGFRTLSQRHARIRATSSGTLEIEDLGSRNGTFIRLRPGRSVELSGRGEVLLGRDLVMQVGGYVWGLPEEERFAGKPEELVALLESRLQTVAKEVRIGKASDPATDSATQLPLAAGSQVTVVWKGATSDVEAEQWLRAVVSLFNSQSSLLRSNSSPWIFTGASQGRAQVLALAQRIAPADCTVLIRGSTGSGKDVLANDIHNHSPRARGPFIAINCSAVPESLFESELFGHVRGAFTNAAEARVGLLELAHGGTLFLDELGEMPMSVQAKLLRFLEDRKVRPIGGRSERRIDVRIMAATNQPLERMVGDGKFREDLFYRLNTVQLTIPPLQALDVQVLSYALLKRLTETQGIEIPTRERDQLAQRAAGATWPGGARQLRGALERYLLLRDPHAPLAENWQNMLESGSPVTSAPQAAKTALTSLAQAPLSAVKLVDNLLFLATAKATLEGDARAGVSEIAARVGLTYQGVVNRLRNLDVKLDGQDDTRKLAERFAEEHAAIDPHLPWLHSVLWG